MSRSRNTKPSYSASFRVLSRFWPQIRRQKLLLTGSFLALLGEIALRLLEPWPLKFVFDRVIKVEPSEGGSGVGFIDGMSTDMLLLVAALSVVLFAALRAGCAYLSATGFALAGNRVVTEVRSDLYRHMQRLSLSFHTRARAGDLMTRVTGDVSRMQDATISAAVPLMAHLLTMTGMVAVMFVLNYQLALVGMVAFPLVLLSMLRFSGPIQEVSRTQRYSEGALAASAAESLGSIKVVQALSLESILERDFSGHNDASFTQGIRAARLTAALERSVDLLIAVGTALVLWYGARLVLRGSITPGELLVFITYMKNAVRPMRDLAKYTGRIARATAAGERVIDVLDQTPDIQDAPHARRAPKLRGEIQFESVTFGYEPGTAVLHEIDLHVGAGRRIALVGPSGAGKSSLTGLLLRLYDPTAGRVLLDGRDVRDYTLESIRSQIAIVLQESVLFAVSAGDNIAYGLPGASQRQIEDAARLANAHDFISALPDGYDTILGERGATLSGGERQRIAIARAAMRRASIVILDEPTTGLDRENAQEVNEALKRLVEGCTTIVIAHELATIEDVDQIIYLDEGRVVESGTHAELLARGGRYAALGALQNGGRSLRTRHDQRPRQPSAPREGGADGGGYQGASRPKPASA